MAQRQGRMGPSVRRENGASLRSPCGERRRKYEKSTPASSTGSGHVRSTPEPRLVTCPTILGPEVRLQVAPIIAMGARIQGNYRPDEREDFHLSPVSYRRLWQQNAHSNTRRYRHTCGISFV